MCFALVLKCLRFANHRKHSRIGNSFARVRCRVQLTAVVVCLQQVAPTAPNLPSSKSVNVPPGTSTVFRMLRGRCWAAASWRSASGPSPPAAAASSPSLSLLELLLEPLLLLGLEELSPFPSFSPGPLFSPPTYSLNHCRGSITGGKWGEGDSKIFWVAERAQRENVADCYLTSY
jgi:hypothetical protein